MSAGLKSSSLMANFDSFFVFHNLPSILPSLVSTTREGLFYVLYILQKVYNITKKKGSILVIMSIIIILLKVYNYNQEREIQRRKEHENIYFYQKY